MLFYAFRYGIVCSSSRTVQCWKSEQKSSFILPADSPRKAFATFPPTLQKNPSDAAAVLRKYYCSITWRAADCVQFCLLHGNEIADLPVPAEWWWVPSWVFRGPIVRCRSRQWLFVRTQIQSFGRETRSERICQHLPRKKSLWVIALQAESSGLIEILSLFCSFYSSDIVEGFAIATDSMLNKSSVGQVRLLYLLKNIQRQFFQTR